VPERNEKRAGRREGRRGSNTGMLASPRTARQSDRKCFDSRTWSSRKGKFSSVEKRGGRAVSAFWRVRKADEKKGAKTFQFEKVRPNKRRGRHETVGSREPFVQATRTLLNCVNPETKGGNQLEGGEGERAKTRHILANKRKTWQCLLGHHEHLRRDRKTE